MHLVASLEDAAGPANPYFGSGEPIDDEAVPRPDPRLTIEPFVGHRLWALTPGTAAGDRPEHPLLRSTTRRVVWEGPDHTAACLHRSGRDRPHPTEAVPAVGCRCGLYALKRPAPPPRPWVWAVGRVSLTGRVLEGTLGYRAERGRVLGPLRLSIGGDHPTCLRPGCRRPASWMRIGPSLYLPRCDRHLRAHADRLLDVPMDDFLEAAARSLAARYGARVEGA
ncbi:MAG: hypothetical protein KQH83_01425 [Actinobacteria bacterium]|nr:hypothetical protein [Actinomycetota bacterium]